jgi:hypothetical protein
MGESSARRRLPSRENIGTLVHPGQLSRFGRVVWALWPDEPIATLAKHAKCTKRHAIFLCEGKRKPNARAALAVYAEIIG